MSKFQGMGEFKGMDALIGEPPKENILSLDRSVKPGSRAEAMDKFAKRLENSSPEEKEMLMRELAKKWMEA